MSAHAVLSPEAKAALARQKRQATISSLLISILAIVLVGLVLFYIAIKGLRIDQPDIVTYKAAAPKERELETKKINPSVQRKPSSPSSSMAKVIAANTTSPTAIPVPDEITPVQSLDFGDGDDFGAGWGSGGGGGGGGGTTFFGQESKAERIAFVIDYSASMNAQNRVGIMKKELSDSLAKLAVGTEYQMIFFAGPVWVAGSEVLDPKAKDESEVKGEDGRTYKWVTSGGAHGWKPRGAKQTAKWLKIPSGEGLIGNQKREAKAEGKENLKRSQKIVKNTPLVWGTRWKYALEMALDMQPPPEVIYFMTDGSSGSDALKTSKALGSSAKNKGITINCIAMMEPRAVEAMKELAKRSGGQFTLVEQNGERKVIPLK